jgi:protein-S-isoprenylcysteine O-methyltransferase Ste14
MKTRLAALALLLTTTVSAQNTHTDMMRSDLKIYVVVAVLLLIFVGIIVYLLGMDRRLSKLENDNR